ncbi:hypothetical protein DEE10_22750, partial [Escherichia coli]|nr:hypothetical protein [Escherichia coli]EFY0810103.1 hypothetical protein [Shigella sonnei]
LNAIRLNNDAKNIPNLASLLVIMQCSLSDSSGCHFVHMRTFMFHISNLWVLCLILKQHQQLLRFHLPSNFSCCR